jgi:PHD/YefM family antitoxin component YafN of YafNO toxin-antitoxin module
LLVGIENEAYSFVVTKHGNPMAVVLNYIEYSRMLETLKLLRGCQRLQYLDYGLDQVSRGV